MPASDETVSSPECRCDCGQLLARRTKDGVEIKCKRCRRVVPVLWQPEDKR